LIRHHRLIAVVAGLFVLGGIYCLIDSNHLHVRTVNIPPGPFSKMLKGKVVVHLSDLHFSRNSSAQQIEIRAKLAALKPDLVLLTGDFVRWFGERQDYQSVFAFLSTLDAPLGVFAVLGDADFTAERESCGFCHSVDPIRPTPLNHVRVMMDTFNDVPIGPGTLRIVALGPPTESNPDLRRLPELLDRHPVILLNHSSSVYSSVDPERNVLVLSGDTHGGEIYLPAFLWKTWKRKPDPDHMHGYYRDGNKQLYVTSGIGKDLPFRFGVPPEIAVLRFN
jgi:predicted MPP superfamily phosphohydrolase